MEYNIDDKPIVIDIKESHWHTSYIYRELLKFEDRCKQPIDPKGPGLQYYQENLILLKEEYKRCVVYDRMNSALKTTTLIIN
jgi:hypothetical protein